MNERAEGNIFRRFLGPETNVYESRARVRMCNMTRWEFILVCQEALLLGGLLV